MPIRFRKYYVAIGGCLALLIAGGAMGQADNQARNPDVEQGAPTSPPLDPNQSPEDNDPQPSVQPNSEPSERNRAPNSSSKQELGSRTDEGRVQGTPSPEHDPSATASHNTYSPDSHAPERSNVEIQKESADGLWRWVANNIGGKEGWAQWVMAIMSVFATGLSAWAILLLRRTLRATVAAVREAEKSTEAAQTAARHGAASAEIALAVEQPFWSVPSVVVQPAELGAILYDAPNRELRIEVRLRNIGRTNALITAHGASVLISAEEPRSFPAMKLLPQNTIVRANVQNQEGAHSFDHPYVISALDSDAIIEGRFKLYIFIVFQYQDFSGIRHEIGFCHTNDRPQFMGRMVQRGPDALQYHRQDRSHLESSAGLGAFST